MLRCALILRLAVLFSLVVLAGCVYQEEIEFDENGTGRMRIVFEQPELNLAERAVFAAYKKNPFNRKDMGYKLPPGVEMIEYKEETKDKRKFVYVTYKFDDLNKLATWKRDDESDLIFRGLSLTKAGNTWVFKRLAKARDKEQSETFEKHFSQSKITLKITGPGKLVVEESNPHRIENENTCIWEGTFPKLLGGTDGQGTHLKAQYYAGSPLWVKVAIVVVLLVIIGGVVAVLLRKKPKTPPTTDAKNASDVAKGPA